MLPTHSHNAFAGFPEPADASRFSDTMHRLLGYMAKAATCNTPDPQVRILGPAYTLDMVCHAGRLRRVTADLRSLFSQRFLIGKLRADGTAHLYIGGVKLFMHFLQHEHLFYQVAQDLKEAVQLCDGPPQKNHVG